MLRTYLIIFDIVDRQRQLTSIWWSEETINQEKNKTDCNLHSKWFIKHLLSLQVTQEDFPMVCTTA